MSESVIGFMVLSLYCQVCTDVLTRLVAPIANKYSGSTLSFISHIAYASSVNWLSHPVAQEFSDLLHLAFRDVSQGEDGGGESHMWASKGRTEKVLDVEHFSLN